MLYKILPYCIFSPLFGDRRKWGVKTDKTDAEFIQWEKDYIKFYQDNQKGLLGNIVNGFGFQIVKNIDFSNKKILEIGPGIIQHINYADYSKSQEYIILDINMDFLEKSENILLEHGVSNLSKMVAYGDKLDLENESVDIILTFHQLEHVYELDSYVKELKRVLKPGGLLVGSVPTEGGIAWGIGRYLTSRRYVRKNMSFDYDKIICWEHPNFVDNIERKLDDNFSLVSSRRRPFPFLPFDINLSWSFVYQK